MAEKRNIEATQNSESFAVCSKCSRVSNNVDKCDKCGSQLTKDNSAECFSSDPKRPRLETPASSAAAATVTTNGTVTAPVVNGTASASVISNGVANGITNGVANGIGVSVPQVVTNGTRQALPVSLTLNPSLMNPAPVPQQLYMNTMNAGNLQPAIPQAAQPRPTQLYVNVNQTPGGAVFPGVTSQALTNPNLMPAVNGNATLRPAHAGPPTSMIPASRPQANLAAAGLATSTMANPPPAYPNNRPGAVQQPPQINKFYINVQQIRIGLRGFAPASTVQFKDDGVLFTLKEHPNAPLLLNIRAIMKCRANLKGPFQALFFYLESSCIKQIRTIFHMKEYEFNEKSSIDKVKCVAVLPSGLQDQEARKIENIFSIMKASANRPEPILDIITPEDVLDILYGTPSQVNDIHEAQVAAGHVAQQQQRNGHASNGSPANRASAMPPASANLGHMGGARIAAPPANQNRPMQPSLQQQLAQRQVAPPNRTAPTNTRPPLVANPGSGPPPTLVIPSDTARWQQMKKGLLVGGVYQVQMQNGQRKYCLWNGTELLPCLVQDTEVQLKCTNVRIGSLKGVANSHVKVQNDANNRGIAVTFKMAGRPAPISLFIPQSGITECYLCVQPSFQALFLYTTQTVSSKICNLCGMTNWQADPYYSASSKKERQRHLIFFLQGVNNDQREALLTLKVSTTAQRPLMKEVTLMKALEILSAIKGDSMVQGKIEDFMAGGKKAPGQSPSPAEVDSLVKYVSGVDEAPSGGGSAAAPVDDDDDDVIMTSTEIGVKCPYTQKVMVEPVKNTKCGHNYEKAAILEFIQRKKAKNIEAKCPYAGCGNQVPLKVQDLKDDLELKAYIAKQNIKT